MVPAKPVMDSSFANRIAEWARAIPVRRAGESPEDSAAFIELFNSTYSRQVTPAYYSWRFCRPGTGATGFFAGDQRRAKGIYGYHLLDMSCRKRFSAALMVDMIVERRFRAAGVVFSRLCSAVEESAVQNGAKALFLLPNDRSLPIWLADKGCRQLSRMNTCTCQTVGGNGARGLTISKVSGFGNWLQGVAQGFRQNHPNLVAVKRGAEYLNWRFCTHPIYHYDLFRVDRDGTPFGYVVLKQFCEPVTGDICGDIVDVLWSEDDPAALAEVLQFALGHFHSQGVGRASIWLQTNTILDQLGRELGFAETGSGRSFCVKILNEQFRWLQDASRWFITMADSEIY
jgi:hypothetical protein